VMEYDNDDDDDTALLSANSVIWMLKTALLMWSYYCIWIPYFNGFNQDKMPFIWYSTYRYWLTECLILQTMIWWSLVHPERKDELTALSVLRLFKTILSLSDADERIVKANFNTLCQKCIRTLWNKAQWIRILRNKSKIKVWQTWVIWGLALYVNWKILHKCLNKGDLYQLNKKIIA
jgi:hypothetical protein